MPVRQIPILNNKEEFASFQDKICIINLLDKDAPGMGGHITQVMGDAGNTIHEYDAIAQYHGAIMSWDDPVLQEEISKIPTKVDVTKLNLITEEQAKYIQRGNVVDLRHLPFVTVDPATCKDMDDAIYSTFNENGDFVCYTAVANVIKYVDLNSEIGKRYMAGGFTIYAPNKAYSILPPQLSTVICSLNPNEDRLAFVVKTVIDKNTGKVKDSNIYDAIICSQNKYSYQQAQEIVDDLELEEGYTKQTLLDLYNAGEALLLEEQLLMNYYSAQTIKKGFEARKMIRFNANNEKEVIFDQDLQTVIDINSVEHLLYHEVIESFMITANEATAKYAKDNNLDNVYRIHKKPNVNKLERANEFFYILGIDFDGDLSAEKTRELVSLIKGTTNEEIINRFLIKMQSRAVYSNQLYKDIKGEVVDEESEGISHYALQSPHYSHTTSPIRRTPDYVTQYNILAHKHGTTPLQKNTIIKIVQVANERQLEVDQAEKEFAEVNAVMYCEQHIGDKLFGSVVKFRKVEAENHRDSNIIVIVSNEEKGINAEIPLSQTIGKSCRNCEVSPQGCAVYDNRGDVVCKICQPVDFIIAKADRKEMKIVGKTNKEMVAEAEQRLNRGRKYYKCKPYTKKQTISKEQPQKEWGEE